MTKQQTVERILQYRERIQTPIKHICFILTIALCLVVMAAVLSRYLLPQPIQFADAASKYLFIWFSMLGAGLAVKDGSHIAVDILTRRFHGRALDFTLLLINLCVSAMLVLFIWHGTKYAIFGFGLSDTDIWNMPLGYAYSAIPIGLTYVLLEVNIEAALYWLSGSKSADIEG